jgi:hypothetical protein
VYADLVTLMPQVVLALSPLAYRAWTKRSAAAAASSAA